MSVCIVWFWFIFFFKQKTAYEMRISHWSSDVCSSDLIAAVLRPLALQVARRERDLPGGLRDRSREVHPCRAAGNVVVFPLRTVVDRRHPRPLDQLVLLAIVAVLQLPARVVADLRECGEVVEEGAVVDHRGVAAVEREAVRTRRVAELQVHCRARCGWRRSGASARWAMRVRPIPLSPKGGQGIPVIPKSVPRAMWRMRSRMPGGCSQAR